MMEFLLSLLMVPNKVIDAFRCSLVSLQNHKFKIGNFVCVKTCLIISKGIAEVSWAICRFSFLFLACSRVPWSSICTGSFEFWMAWIASFVVLYVFWWFFGCILQWQVLVFWVIFVGDEWFNSNVIMQWQGDESWICKYWRNKVKCRQLQVIDHQISILRLLFMDLMNETLLTDSRVTRFSDYVY